MPNRLLIYLRHLLFVLLGLSACTDKLSKNLIPKPGQELLPQVYIFFDKSQSLQGIENLQSLPSVSSLENEVNGRIEFIPMDASAAAIEAMRNRFSRPADLVVFKGALSQKAFLDARLPREDKRKILFLGAPGLGKNVIADPNWYQASIDIKAIQTFAEELCSSAGMGNCTSLPVDVLGSITQKTDLPVKPVQLRFGSLDQLLVPNGPLQATVLRRPYIDVRIAWERLFQALVDPKLSAYISKKLLIGPSSPYFELELDNSEPRSSKLSKAFNAKRRDLQLKALQKGL